MPANGDFEFRDLDRFGEDIAKLAKDLPEKYEKMLMKVGNQILASEAQQLISDGAVKSKRLIESFQKKSHGKYKETILQKIGKDAITAGSSTFYGEMLSDGHRQVTYKLLKDKKGKRNRKRRKGKELKESQFAGTHFMDKGIKKAENKIPEIVASTLFDAFQKTYGGP